jgi:hypothetical protein
MSSFKNKPIGWLSNERIKAELGLYFDGEYRLGNAVISYKGVDAVPKVYSVKADGLNVCLPKIFYNLTAAIEYAASCKELAKYAPQADDKQKAVAGIHESKFDRVETVDEWIKRTSKQPTEGKPGKTGKKSVKKTSYQMFDDWMSDQTTGECGGVSEYSLNLKDKDWLAQKVNDILNE